MVKFLLYIEPRKQRVLWNQCCLSISHCADWSVQHFSPSAVDYFSSNFLNEVTLFQHLRNDSLIIAKISIQLIFKTKAPQNTAFRCCFLKLCYFTFLKEKYSLKGELVWYLTSNPRFHVWQIYKSWVFAQLSINQTVGFLKFLYLNNKLRYEIDFLYVSNKLIGLGQT